MYLFVVFLLQAVLLVNCAVDEHGHEGDMETEVDTTPGRGWGADIDWVSYDEAFDAAEKENKPIFLMMAKTWCPACQNLKKTFVKAKEIRKLAKNFIMVHTIDDEEPETELLAIDGHYIPRLYFLAPDGTVQKDILNENMKDSSNKYYYPDPNPIIKSMKKVIQRFIPKEEL